jgi:hypothetical protein
MARINTKRESAEREAHCLWKAKTFAKEIVGNQAPSTVVDNPQYPRQDQAPSPGSLACHPETVGGLGGDLDASMLFRRRIICIFHRAGNVW